MTAPNMATITESLERSLQNCSLNNHRRNGGAMAVEEGTSRHHEEGMGRSSSSDDNNLQNTDTALELNSHLTLPYHWEQCLDLKTGEIYYINWRNGMKAKEDPRTTADSSGDFYSEEDDSSYDSEESSSESSPSSSTTRDHYNNNNNNRNHHRVGDNNVLVVAGCKSCLMYFMVPKQVEDCPKCNGQLLHFDRSDNSASSP